LWLGVALLLALVPASFAVERGHNSNQKRTDGVESVAVPEGGSAAIYLLGAGLTCLGAMFVRSRNSKRCR
jgi:hypothetical protein